MGLRDQLQKSPWIGWVVAGLAIAVAVWFQMRRSFHMDDTTPERMSEMVTIKFTDTGDTIQMLRGKLDKEIRLRSSGVIDPNEGIINPKTGKPTGFLFDQGEWNRMVDRINADKAALSRTPAAPPGKPK